MFNVGTFPDLGIHPIDAWLVPSMNFTIQQHFEKFVHKGLSLAIYLKEEKYEKS